MAANFMEAGTEISGLKEKKHQVLTKVASVLAEACVARAGSGKANDEMKRDVKNLISDLPVEDQNVVLTEALVAICKNISGKGGSNKQKEVTRSSIFANRGF